MGDPCGLSTAAPALLNGTAHFIVDRAIGAVAGLVVVPGVLGVLPRKRPRVTFPLAESILALCQSIRPH